MRLEPENANHPAMEAGSGDQAAINEQIEERVRFLFRQAGDNLPAVELEQQIKTYRLQGGRR